jgi:hypothetical protein
MANVIGQLLVELGVNTAYLKEGFREATYETKKFGKEVEETFRELGKSTSELAVAFGVLGPAGAEIAGALNLAGQAAGKMMREFAGVSSTWGFAAAGAAGVAAAFASLSLGAIELATHTASEIKEMKESATIAGMTTEEFTRFGYAAKQAGVSQEGFTSSMSRFGNKMVQASQGNKAAQAEFDLMGVKVADADGKMRKMGDVLLDVSDWFAKTADGAVKNNAAMTIGGRGFKQMIPLLNEGREGLKKWADEADALGVVVDSSTAEMMEKYTQTITAIKTAGDGLAIQLSKELVPALQGVATAIKEDLKSPDSDIKKLVDGIAMIAHWFVDLVAIAGAALGQIGQFFQEMGAKAIVQWNALTEAGKKALHGDFKGAAASMEAASRQMDDVNALFAKQTEERWLRVWKVIRGEGEDKGKEREREEATPPKINRGGGLGQNIDETEKWIRTQRLAGQAAAELAKGIGETSAAIEMHAAKTKADEDIEKRMGDLLQKRAEHEKSLKEATEGETKNKAGEEKYRELVANDNKQIAELKRFHDEYVKIKQDEVAQAAIAEAQKSIAKKGLDISQEIADQQKLAAAMKEGGESVYIAEATLKLKEQAKALELARQKADEFAKEHPTETQAIKDNNDALELQAAAYEKDLKAEEELLKVEFQKKVDDEIRSIDQQTQSILANARALSLTAEERAKVKARETADQFKVKNPNADAAQVEAEYQAALRKGNAEIQASEIAKANELDILHKYEDQKKVLDDILASSNISAGVRKEAQIEEYQNAIKLRTELDDMMAKSQNISDVMLAWADRLAAELPKLGNDFGNDMIKAVDQFNSALINAIGTGKINFHSLLVSIAKDFATTALKGTEGLIASLATGQGATGQGKGIGGIFASLFGGNKGGADGKPKGTSLDPIYTAPAGNGSDWKDAIDKGEGYGQGDNSGGDGSGVTGGLSGLLNGLMGKLGGMFSSLFGSLGGVFSKILGGLGGMFGGFLASGGDVTPGKAYVVGEHHPEFFIPRASGHVAPTMRTADAPKTYVSNVHFHGVTDADSFRRSQSQIMQGVGFGMSAALGRK